MATVINTPDAGRKVEVGSEVVPVYIWQWPIRIAHWMIALSLVVLTVTGFYMHRLFWVATSPRDWVMGTARFVHELFGFILIAVLILRFYWFFAGNRWAHWRAWVPLNRGNGKACEACFCTTPIRDVARLLRLVIIRWRLRPI